MDTLSDTAKLILAVFSKYGIKDRYSLSFLDLLFKEAKWEQHHQDNFTKSINELHDKGLIEWGEQYVVVLTRAGYEAFSQLGG